MSEKGVLIKLMAVLPGHLICANHLLGAAPAPSHSLPHNLLRKKAPAPRQCYKEDHLAVFGEGPDLVAGSLQEGGGKNGFPPILARDHH